MKYLKIILRASLVTSILLTLLAILLNIIIHKDHNWDGIFFLLLSNFLLSLVMAYYVYNSTLSGNKLIGMTFVIGYIIGNFNIMVEALIFHVTDNMGTIDAMVLGIINFSALSIALTLLLKNKNEKNFLMHYPPRTLFTWSTRLAASVLLYAVIYFVAGMILQLAYPSLHDFYAGKIPALTLILKTQLLRGAVFTAIALVVIYTVNLKSFQASLLVGFIFSILGGIAPLIPMNELMPFHIRMVHGLEVGISNFVFGFSISQLLSNRLKALPDTKVSPI